MARLACDIIALFRLLVGRWSRGKTWNQLRSAGNSRAVQISGVFPFIGYLIILNENVAQFLGLNDADGSTIGANWKLYFVYFGLLSTGLGSAIYQAFCPFIIKKHGDWADYVRIDGGSFSVPSIQSLGVALGRPTDNLLAAEINVKMDYLREWYSFQSHSIGSARIFVTILFDLGFSLLAVPSISSALKILLSIIQHFK